MPVCQGTQGFFIGAVFFLTLAGAVVNFQFVVQYHSQLLWGRNVQIGFSGIVAHLFFNGICLGLQFFSVSFHLPGVNFYTFRFYSRQDFHQGHFHVQVELLHAVFFQGQP